MKSSQIAPRTVRTYVKHTPDKSEAFQWIVIVFWAYIWLKTLWLLSTCASPHTAHFTYSWNNAMRSLLLLHHQKCINCIMCNRVHLQDVPSLACFPLQQWLSSWIAFSVDTNRGFHLLLQISIWVAFSVQLHAKAGLQWVVTLIRIHLWCSFPSGRIGQSNCW